MPDLTTVKALNRLNLDKESSEKAEHQTGLIFDPDHIPKIQRSPALKPKFDEFYPTVSPAVLSRKTEKNHGQNPSTISPYPVTKPLAYPVTEPQALTGKILKSMEAKLLPDKSHTTKSLALTQKETLGKCWQPQVNSPNMDEKVEITPKTHQRNARKSPSPTKKISPSSSSQENIEKMPEVRKIYHPDTFIPGNAIESRMSSKMLTALPLKPTGNVTSPSGASGKPEAAQTTNFSGFGGGSVEHGGYSDRMKRDSVGGNGSGAKFTSAGAASCMGESDAGSRLLIKGGNVVNEDSIVFADVYVEDGIIKDVAPNLQVPPGTKIIDAKGKYVMPGGIDPHTHFQVMFFGTHSVDDFEAGTRAAIAGGTTMIIDFVMTYKNDSLLSTYEKYRSWADHNVCCDYGLSVVVSHVNDKIKNEMTELVKHKGINSFKFFLAYHDVLQVSDEDFYEGLVHCRKLGALARVHAENGDLIAAKEKELLAVGITGPEGHLQARPEEAAEEATYRACLLAREANCPLYVVHVMSQGSSDVIGEARKRGAVVFGEAVGSALASIDGANVYHSCWRHAAAHVVSPPLSVDHATGGRLLDALAAGQLHTTGSDHAAFDSTQKALGKNDFTKIPNGVNGVEERLMVVWQKGVNSGKMDPMRFVAVTSSTAAKLFNIYPKKGRIAPHSDADIVVWDPEARRILSAQSHFSKCDFNIFEGMECVGCPQITICGGKVVYENGQVNSTARGTGQFVALLPFAPQAFATVGPREKSRQPIKIDRSATGNGLPSNLLLSSTTTRTPASTPSGVTSPSSSSLNDGDIIGGGGKFDSALHVTSPSAAVSTTADFHNRPTTRSGGRNLQDSSFTLSGAQIDDDQAARRFTKISKPPGGESRGLW